MKLNLGTGQICTKTKLHEGNKLHDGSILHKDNFAPMVNFTGLTILHAG